MAGSEAGWPGPRPAWKGEPVPANVRRTWPSVQSWEWLSPLRLRGQHEQPGAAYLVVIDEARTDALGQAVGAATAADPEAVRRVFAELRMALMRNIGRRAACLDATPVCHDDGRCVYCGLVPGEHDEPGSAEPLRQATHVGWPGGPVITTTEFEGAFDVEMEAMRAGETPALDPGDDPECE